MAGLSFLVLFISHFFVYDCSSVLDLKAIASSTQEVTKSKEVDDLVILNEKSQEIEQREKCSKNEQLSINEDSLHTIYEEVEPDFENVNDAEGHTVRTWLHQYINPGLTIYFTFSVPGLILTSGLCVCTRHVSSSIDLGLALSLRTFHPSHFQS